MAVSQRYSLDERQSLTSLESQALSYYSGLVQNKTQMDYTQYTELDNGLQSPDFTSAQAVTQIRICFAISRAPTTLIN